MKFYDYPLMYSRIRQLDRDVRKLTADVFYADVIRDSFKSWTRLTPSGATQAELRRGDSTRMHAGMDRRWVQKLRPFYNVWPKIIPMLIRLDLAQVQQSMLYPKHDVMCFRFPVQDNPMQSGGIALRSMLAGPAESNIGPCYNMVCDYGETDENGVIYSTDMLCIKPNQSLADSIASQVPQAVPGLQIPEDLRMNVWRLVFTIVLLDDNPELIESIVLAADREAYERTGDMKYVDKAGRRGVVGWDIGKRIEVMPHYRRPTMALVWTGAGRMIPKIVPRRGCIVHKEAVVQVPTGEQGAVEGQL